MAKPDRDTWSVGARSETGYVRDENQDRMGWIRAPFGDVYIVSDGMGGVGDGALAAELTVQTLQRHLGSVRAGYRLRTALRRAFTAANAVVHARSQGDDGTPGMGATAVVVVLRASSVLVAHVGDSRAYLCNDSGCQRLTRDHSLVQRMVDRGQLTAAQALDHPDANLIDRAIGLKPQVDVEIGAWLPVHGGDWIMLCSDGLCGYAHDAEIAAVLHAHTAAQEAADGLIALALAKGGEDNVTVQVIRYDRGEAERRGMRTTGYLALVLTTAAASAATVLISQRLMPPSPQELVMQRHMAGLQHRVLTHDATSAALLQRAAAQAGRLDARIDSLERTLGQLQPCTVPATVRVPGTRQQASRLARPAAQQQRHPPKVQP